MSPTLAQKPKRESVQSGVFTNSRDLIAEAITYLGGSADFERLDIECPLDTASLRGVIGYMVEDGAVVLKDGIYSLP